MSKGRAAASSPGATKEQRQVSAVYSMGKLMFHTSPDQLDSLVLATYGLPLGKLSAVQLASVADLLKHGPAMVPDHLKREGAVAHLQAERDRLVERLEQGWQIVAEAKQSGDPRADRWEDAWIDLLADYTRAEDQLAAYEALQSPLEDDEQELLAA